MQFPTLALLLAATATTTTIASAIPDTSPVPDISPRAALFQGDCGPSDAVPCSVENAQKCVNYLIGLGNAKCNANQNTETIYCRFDKCSLSGIAIGAAQTSSYCKDVGHGAQTIINRCKNNGKVKGNEAAGGNGNLILEFRADV